MSACHGFLGNTQVLSYQEFLRIWDAECQSKFTLSTSTFNFFSLNLRAVSEHGERFHHDITKMERDYQRKCKLSMMGWGLLLRDITDAKDTRSFKKPTSVCCDMTCVFGIIQVI